MTTLTDTMHDSMTMLRRDLRHVSRYPVTVIVAAGVPLVFLLLLFVFVLGETLGAGLGAGTAGGGSGLAGPVGGRAEYLAYITPALLVLAVASAAQGTAISVATDMTSGIIARLRTMPISRSAVLSGHVLGNVIQMMIGVTLVTGIALLVGFRPTASPAEWLAVTALVGALSVVFTWFSVGCGLVTRSVEAASNLPMPLSLLPFLGSGFVPTDSLPTGLRWFAEYQPFTPVIETLRGLLLGGPIGRNGVIALAWCAAIGLASYLWARRLYGRDRTR